MHNFERTGRRTVILMAVVAAVAVLSHFLGFIP